MDGKPHKKLEAWPKAAGPAWEVWKKVARAIAEFNNRALLILLYVVLLMPFGLGLRLVADPLRRRKPVASNWIVRTETPATLEDARRQ